MFNDRYGLTAAVLLGCKTMTRRAAKKLNHPLVTDISEWGIDDKGKCYLTTTYSTGLTEVVYPPYQIGEEIAIAQPYKDMCLTDPILFEVLPLKAGWSNKMFVAAEYMPHRICITDIKGERLHDISEEDAMREGIFKYDKPPLHHEMDLYAPWPPYVKPYKHNNENLKYSCSARYAFAYLIDKVSGTGTWQRNPWVFVYEFELSK